MRSLKANSLILRFVGLGIGCGLVLVFSLLLLVRDESRLLGVILVCGLLLSGLTLTIRWRIEGLQNARADAAANALARGSKLLLAASNASSLDSVIRSIRATAREMVGARDIEIYLQAPDSTHEEPQARATRAVLARQSPLCWPDDRTSSALLSASKIKSLIAAPLMLPQIELKDGKNNRELSGAIVAWNQRNGGRFTRRDTLLLSALAEAAALALENWHFSEALRGRIEAANQELENAYNLLAEQSAKLVASVESIDSALVISDPAGNAVFVNRAAIKVLRGATPISGEPIASALREDGLDRLAELFENLSPEVEATHLEISRRRDVLSGQFTPLQGENGEFLGAMLVVSDITAQRELDRMKTDFVGYVAHELRSPLTTILGFADLLNQIGPGAPENMRASAETTRSMTEAISRHCRRMNRMISDLLDVSRVEAGVPIYISKNCFDLAELCESLLQEQRAYLNPTPVIELVLDCPQRPFDIFADDDRVEQIMTNLLSNAVKYSPDGGTITVSLRKDETTDSAIITVSDEGMGLTGEQLKKLFTKFYRTSDAHDRKIKGNGLGLSLIQQLINAHGGSIEVSSARDAGGKGAVFRVVLPNDAPNKASGS